MGKPTSLQTAYSVYRQSIGEVPKQDPPCEPEKDPAAAELGRKGGKATADKRSPEERSAAAKRAVEARWAKQREAEKQGANRAHKKNA